MEQLQFNTSTPLGLSVRTTQELLLSIAQVASDVCQIQDPRIAQLVFRLTTAANDLNNEILNLLQICLKTPKYSFYGTWLDADGKPRQTKWHMTEGVDQEVIKQRMLEYITSQAPLSREGYTSNSARVSVLINHD